jgi:TatD DNase family protein
MIDTHTHLNFRAFGNDWEEVVDRALKSGVRKMIVVGTDIESSKRAIEMAEKHPALYASIGVHPHHVRAMRKEIPRQSGSSQETRSARAFGSEAQARRDDKAGLKSVPALSNTIIQLKRLVKHPKVVAIGEVGLDYHQYSKTKYESQITNQEWIGIKKLQKKLFKMQIEVAWEFKKPLIIHSREAGEEVIDLIINISKQKKWELKGVFHCFEGDLSYLKKVIRAGFFVSFTGNITYSDDRLGVLKKVPLNRLLLETDCPFMAPMSHRGERSEPAHVKIIADHHAYMRSIHLNKVKEITARNSKYLFQI